MTFDLDKVKANKPCMVNACSFYDGFPKFLL